MENITAKPQIHEHTLTGALLFLLVMMFVHTGPLLAQSKKEKAAKYFDKAISAYQLRELQQCEDLLKKTIKEDSTFCDAYILSGDLAQESGDLEGSALAYRKALDCGPDRPAIVMELLGNALFEMERYGEASHYYGKVIDSPGLRNDLRNNLVGRKSMADYRHYLMDNPVAFKPENLGEAINSANEEYINAIRTEADELVFTRKVPLVDDPLQREFEEDFYHSRLSDTGWMSAERFSFITSAFGDAGGLCMTADGRQLFFTACFRKDSQGSCDIYYAEKIGEKWTEPKNMGDVVNSDNWDAQPAVSPDGNTLYFASNREGSLGSSDIWVTRRLPGNAWSRPENIGPPVNSRGAEMAPFIHFDNQTLYFSSQGHPGMGGYDLFMSKRTGNGWGEPLNIGYPVNTRADELVVVVSADGLQAYISAELKGGLGGFDIYSFRLDEKMMPLPVTYLKGKVFDSETRAALVADVELYDLAKDSLVMRSSSSDDGTFLVCLPAGRSYALNVSRKGYLFCSDHFELVNVKEIKDPYLKDIPLEKIQVGSVVVMKNVFYETDEYDLKAESATELNKLADFLSKNPGVRIEISGHTDNTGTPEHNQELSEKRAMSVYNYLVKCGIDANRLEYAGYGYTLPVAGNDTEEGRAENRRTEIKIVGTNGG